jgi:hypothetical protein
VWPCRKQQQCSRHLRHQQQHVPPGSVAVWHVGPDSPAAVPRLATGGAASRGRQPPQGAPGCAPSAAEAAQPAAGERRWPRCVVQHACLGSRMAWHLATTSRQAH